MLFCVEHNELPIEGIEGGKFNNMLTGNMEYNESIFTKFPGLLIFLDIFNIFNDGHTWEKCYQNAFHKMTVIRTYKITNVDIVKIFHSIFRL